MAAERVGQRGYAMEIEPRYVDVAIRRWQAFTRRDAIHIATGHTFDEMAAERMRSTERRERQRHKGKRR
jgi:DNA modification methylase